MGRIEYTKRVANRPPMLTWTSIDEAMKIGVGEKRTNHNASGVNKKKLM